MSTTHDLDITKDHCPMTFVKTKLRLESLPSGATLRVRLNSGEPLDNIPKSVTEQGYHVVSISQVDERVHIVEIQVMEAVSSELP